MIARYSFSIIDHYFCLGGAKYDQVKKLNDKIDYFNILSKRFVTLGSAGVHL